jgi:hypothetical protein
MASNNFTKIILATLLMSSFFGCSKGFQAQSSNSTTSDGANGSQGTNPGIPAAAPIDSVQMKSRVDDTNNQTGFHGALTFDFDKVRGEFIVMIPMPSTVMFTPSGSISSKYPDITIGSLFDPTTGKMKMAVRIPVKYIIKGIQFVAPSKLPNGDPLPAMPAGVGELPALGLTFPAQNNTQVTLYIGINAIGLFMSLPDKASIPIPFNLTFPLKSQDKSRTFGFLTYVAAKGMHQSGLFISTGVPPEFARILEDYFKL